MSDAKEQERQLARALGAVADCVDETIQWMEDRRFEPQRSISEVFEAFQAKLHKKLNEHMKASL